MTQGRMNHGCVTYSEAGRTKIMVAGGVTSLSSPGGEAVVTTSVEVMDWQTRTWTTARALPRRLTGDVTSDGMLRSNIQQSGIKMIKTQNRPTILGQYNFEKQNIVLRYDIKYMYFILTLNINVNFKDTSMGVSSGKHWRPSCLLAARVTSVFSNSLPISREASPSIPT